MLCVSSFLGVGTSPWPCSDIYHGSEALSEVEVANVVAFLRKKKAEGQDFMVFIDWHSYSQVIISPWSYLDSEPRTKDYDDQVRLLYFVSCLVFFCFVMPFNSICLLLYNIFELTEICYIGISMKAVILMYWRDYPV